MKKKNQTIETAQRRSKPNQTRSAKNQSRNTVIPGSRFQHLAQAIATSPVRSQSAGLSHADCVALLEFYIDYELRQQDAQKIYPPVWKHLQTCARCLESYELIKSTLELGQSDQSTSIPALPFFAPAAENAAWSKRVRARVGGAALGFGFIIQPSHLHQLFNSTSAALVRGPATTDERSLLLTDTINLGQRDVMIEIWIKRSEHSSEGQLEISVASSAPLPEPLRAKLQWNDHTYSAIVQQGICSFEHLAISELQNARDLRVEFEAGPSNAVIGGKHGDRSASA